MRALLVGSPAARQRLRRDLETRSIDVAGEFDTMADARQSGLAADVIVSPPEGPIAAGVRADQVFEESLTMREMKVLELLAEGLPNKGIAGRLGISDQTVKFHIASILGKLGAANRLDAVRRAVRRGLLAL